MIDRRPLAPSGRGVLRDDELHVWLVAPSEVPEDELARCGRLLSRDELEERDRFVFDRDRRTFQITRALVRASLSQYCDVAPTAWRFRRTSHGRPFIRPDSSRAPLDFNVSHNDGLIACVVARRANVGVDLENCTRLDDPMELAPSVFAPLELGQLRALDAAQQRARFFELWTLKESYIKARGDGLSLPLRELWFDRDREGRIIVDAAPAVDADPQRWHFELLRASPEHYLAVASAGSVRRAFARLPGTFLSTRARSR